MIMILNNLRKPTFLRFLFALFLTMLLSACGGGDAETSDATPTLKELALDKITAYAEDDTNETPTIQDYVDAGVSGVTSENLDQLNTLVDELELEDVDTTAEIIALTTQLGITIDPTDPTVADQSANWGFKWSDGSVWQ